MEENKFHITVRNTKTGEILLDGDSTAFICLVAGDDGVQTVCELYCDSNTVVNVLYQAQQTIYRICREHPELRRPLSDLTHKNRLESFQKAWYEQEGQE